MKRMTFLFERVEGDGRGWKCRDALVGAFYSALGTVNPGLAKEVHDSSGPKGFAYAVRPAGEIGFSFLLTSLRDDIVDAFNEGIRKTEKIVIDGVAYRLVSAVDIPLVRGLERPCIFWAASPVVVSRPVDGGTGVIRKQYVSAISEPAEFSRRLARNLERRARELAGVDGRVSAFVYPSGKKYLIRYKGGVVEGYSCPVAVDAAEDVLLVAAYGGLGERTGVGFGAVLPAPEVLL